MHYNAQTTKYTLEDRKRENLFLIDNKKAEIVVYNTTAK